MMISQRELCHFLVFVVINWKIDEEARKHEKVCVEFVMFDLSATDKRIK